jgi:Thaumatin family
MVRRISYAGWVRVESVVAVPLVLLAMACGAVSTRTDAGGVSMGADAGMVSADASGASADADGACAEPAFAVPDAGLFKAPAVGPLGTFQVTFHNRCAQTVWPAWGSSGGLDNSVIDTRLWLPMPPASDRAVTVFGGLREIGVWGRTGCSFDQGGSGTCQTGECGGFVCPIIVNAFPASTTVFVLERGFLGGFNVALRVEGATCGSHECVADVRTCSPALVVQDGCGRAIACSDICGGSAQCCSRPGSGCSAGPSDGGPPGSGDLVVTFCP